MLDVRARGPDASRSSLQEKLRTRVVRFPPRVRVSFPASSRANAPHLSPASSFTLKLVYCWFPVSGFSRKLVFVAISNATLADKRGLSRAIGVQFLHALTDLCNNRERFIFLNSWSVVPILLKVRDYEKYRLSNAHKWHLGCTCVEKVYKDRNYKLWIT